jgi:heat shock transcription factor
MNRPLATRKRGAPGASPLSQQQNFNNVPYAGVPEQPQFDQTFNDWGATNAMGDLNNGFLNDATLDNNAFNVGLNSAAGFGAAPGAAGVGLGVGVGNDFTNGQLVRRPPAQQVVSKNQNQWQDAEAGAPGFEQPQQPDDEDDLEQKALAAKKEAQAKRKQIPPFVQKLSR